METSGRIPITHIKIVWRNIITPLFKRTYGDFLSDDELELRVMYVLNNLHEIEPINLFKCILYSDTKNEVGKLAMDYRIEFIGPNYETAIRTGSSFEIDSFHFHDKHLLINEIDDLCMALNVAVNNKITAEVTPMINHRDDILSSIEMLADIMETKLREDNALFWNLNRGIQHYMSINQVVYSVTFNQNPFSGSVMSEGYCKYIKDSFVTRCGLMEQLKRKHKTGIRLELVMNRNFFG